jgi:hypothetical protein
MDLRSRAGGPDGFPSNIPPPGEDLSSKTLWNVELKQIRRQKIKIAIEGLSFPGHWLRSRLATWAVFRVDACSKFQRLRKTLLSANPLIVVTFELLAHPIAAYAVCQRKF